MGIKRGLSIVTIFSVGLALAGCSSPQPEATPTVIPSPVVTTVAPLALVPDAPAAENLAYFDLVNGQTLGANAAADGRTLVDALVAAGFDKAAIEVTPDSTTIGQAADSIVFSVRWSDACLIGQTGASVGGYHSSVQPTLGTGKCLVGQTRTIDW